MTPRTASEAESAGVVVHGIVASDFVVSSSPEWEIVGEDSCRPRATPCVESDVAKSA